MPKMPKSFKRQHNTALRSVTNLTRGFMSTLDSLLDSLINVGFVVIPREVLGFSGEEILNVHNAQLEEIRKRFPGWQQEFKPQWHSEMTKSLAGGFLGVQLLPEQIALEFDDRVKNLFIAIFSKLNGSPYTDEVWTWLERSNVSFAEPMRSRMYQKGALPHIDDNPWSAPLDTTLPYDADKWSPKVRVAGLSDIRPMEKDRPVQAFVALTDCAGGPNSGGKK
jgi:hypothetical protein